MNAKQLAEKTQDAYSADFFAPGEWEKCAAMLLAMQYSAAQAEGILRSKWTRWCRDEFDNGGQGKAEHLREFMVYRNCGIAEVNSLVTTA